MGAMSGLLNDGKLAVVQNVGYPNPNRSHFRSTEIWETASETNQYLSNRAGSVASWTTPAMAHPPPTPIPAACTSPTASRSPSWPSTTTTPSAFRPMATADAAAKISSCSKKLVNHPGAAENDSASFLKHTMMDALVTEKHVQKVLGAYRPAATYPTTLFAASLRNISALIAAGLSTRIYFVSITGFDTHANQLNTQANPPCARFSDGLAAFQKDLEAHKSISRCSP